MLTAQGRVKVLDFGLAKDLRPSDQPDVTVTTPGQTEVGMVMGTPAYMSPEQLAGRPVDHRTDIFSLGILLYQMSSGQRPFEGANSIELASAILRDTPPPLGNVRPGVPGALTRLVQRCLEKDRERRVQTARDVTSELHDIARRPSPDTPRGSDSGSRRTDEGFWLAVLPFKYGGPSAEVAGLAEGLSEEIVTGLARFSYLRVIAHSATLRSSESADVRTVAREIGARYVMEGSVRQAGSQVRIAVQLVDATTGAHLWAETYSRPFQADAIFASAGRSRPAHRVHGCRQPWRAAPQHGRCASRPCQQRVDALRDGASRLQLLCAHRPRRACGRARRARTRRRAGGRQRRRLGPALDALPGRVSTRLQPASPFRSTVRWPPPAAPSISGRRITSPTTRSPRRSSSAGICRPSGRPPNGRSRSIRWMATPWPTWDA